MSRPSGEGKFRPTTRDEGARHLCRFSVDNGLAFETGWKCEH